MKFSEKKISIGSLKLWDENARFPDKYYNSDEKELIKYFLSKPNFKLREFIDEIVNDIDLPHLEKIVVWDSTDKLIVLEGNRRLAGYKLLANPDLVKDIDKNSNDYALVKSINEIAHLMGKKTVAEYAENQAIINVLKEIGVDYIQGYAVGMPTILSDIKLEAESI